MTINPIERLDVPTALLEEQIAVLRASQARHAALGNEQEVVADGDAIYMLLHPELCSTDADYPGWAPGGTR
ncbi:hypothetical protein [Streptomyces nymphaeiformis]|uniref:Uncharacterized protein n=1 Tax=Streptomyces nymphaeiformis TaxID=2663842 RepID=A0A7W7U5D1_9ACTN|nr:hypothetical protein [Streptomyces nymphaeiformis]MBB4984956.1 hypothetical protein [Streptomyces nymphaeiformis]